MSVTKLLRALAIVIGLTIVAGGSASSANLPTDCVPAPQALATANGVTLAQLKTRPKAKASLFCDVCKIQGCGCSGGQCVNCNKLKAPSTSGGTGTPKRTTPPAAIRRR